MEGVCCAFVDSLVLNIYNVAGWRTQQYFRISPIESIGLAGKLIGYCKQELSNGRETLDIDIPKWR